MLGSASRGRCAAATVASGFAAALPDEAGLVAAVAGGVRGGGKGRQAGDRDQQAEHDDLGPDAVHEALAS